MSPDNIQWPLPASSEIIVKSTLEMVYSLVIRFSNSKWLNSKDTGSIYILVLFIFLFIIIPTLF